VASCRVPDKPTQAIVLEDKMSENNWLDTIMQQCKDSMARQFSIMCGFYETCPECGCLMPGQIAVYVGPDIFCHCNDYCECDPKGYKGGVRQLVGDRHICCGRRVRPDSPDLPYFNELLADWVDLARSRRCRLKQVRISPKLWTRIRDTMSPSFVKPLTSTYAAQHIRGFSFGFAPYDVVVWIVEGGADDLPCRRMPENRV
jgi:hypothetical protein